MPRDVMPIMSDRDLALTMADRSGGFGQGMGGPGPAKDPIVESPLWMTEMGTQAEFPYATGSGNLLSLQYDGLRPGGLPVEKDLPGADEFLPDYAGELIEAYPSFRVPSMGPDARHYTEPAQPGRWDATGNLISRPAPRYEMDRPGIRYQTKESIEEGALAGDPQYINGVKQVWLDYEDLVQVYPELANVNPEELSLQSVHGDNEHYFMPEHLWGQYAAIGQADDPNTPEDESIQDLIRYNTQGERTGIAWSTREHERMHYVGQTLLDNAALWESDAVFEDPETGERINLFQLIAPKSGGHPALADPQWDRELMHIAIYRFSPDIENRTRAYQDYKDHRFFADIQKMDISDEEKEMRAMDRAGNLVRALNDAAGYVKSAYDYGFNPDFEYGAGIEGVFGTDSPSVRSGHITERQHLVEDFLKSGKHDHDEPLQGIIGRK